MKFRRWMVKLRVSGPAGKKAEVDAAMGALLSGIQFGARHQVHAAAPIALSECPAELGAEDAKLLPDREGADGAADAFLGTFDGGGVEVHENGRSAVLPSRVPDSLCRRERCRADRHRSCMRRTGGGAP